MLYFFSFFPTSDFPRVLGCLKVGIWPLSYEMAAMHDPELIHQSLETPCPIASFSIRTLSEAKGSKDNNADMASWCY